MTVGEWLQAMQRSEYNGTNRNYSSNRRNDCYSMVVFMSSFNWCHGPSCHKSHTQDRVRGSKGSKVLRTRKIKINQWNKDHYFRFFCSNTCYNNFANTHIERIIAIAPRTEALETPINDPKKDSEGYYNRWVITERGVDTSME